MLVVFLANWIALSPRCQRDEARKLVAERDSEIEELQQSSADQEQLLSARRGLGGLIGDMGEHLVLVRGSEWADGAHSYFDDVLELLRGDNPVFDESHVGRFYSVTTSATGQAYEHSIGPEKAAAEMLRAEIGCLRDFIGEINDVLHSRYGVV